MPNNTVAIPNEDNSFFGKWLTAAQLDATAISAFFQGVSDVAVDNGIAAAAKREAEVKAHLLGDHTPAERSAVAQEAADGVKRAGGNAMEQQAAYNEIMRNITAQDEKNSTLTLPSLPTLPAFNVPNLPAFGDIGAWFSEPFFADSPDGITKGGALAIGAAGLATIAVVGMVRR